MKIINEDVIKDKRDLKKLLLNCEVGTIINFDWKFDKTYIKINKDKNYFSWLNNGKIADNNGSTDSGRYSLIDINEILDIYSYAKKNDKNFSVSYENKYTEEDVKKMISSCLRNGENAKRQTEEIITEDNERSYNPLPDINNLIGKEYINFHRMGKDLEKYDYDLIYYNDNYIHITDARESDGIRYIYQIRHNKNGSVSIEKFVKEDEL